ncbi:unnamed protein product [Somion occarium]|uniref:Peptidyl-prolyl cis-trans isomerase n=1 Tax=Somion occarium TaxID=3059160 RepID=A0ABP1E8E2_9APHY
MIQTGDPSETGKGGQSIWGKPFADEIRSTLKFNNRGIVAMANSGPDTNKSQFFITYAKQPHLDGKYTIFGKVIDGADSTLDTMERTPVDSKNKPLNEIRLTHVRLSLVSCSLLIYFFHISSFRVRIRCIYLYSVGLELPFIQIQSLMLSWLHVDRLDIGRLSAASLIASGYLIATINRHVYSRDVKYSNVPTLYD